MLRRLAPSRIDRLLLVVFVVFVVVTLGRALIGNELLIDVNILTRFPPWQAVNGVAISDTNVCRTDTVDNIMPGIMVVRDALFSGHYATWNQYSVGGVSMGAPNVGQFSPLSLPYYVLPLWLAPAYVKLIEVVVGVIGMVAFLRRLKLSTAAGILGGIVFATTGFMVMWSNWPQVLVGALIPALFWAAERLAQERRLRDAVPLALVVASMLLGGFPAVTGMALYVAGLYFVVRLVVLNRGRSRRVAQGMGSAVVGIVLGVLLSAFQLLPFGRQLSDTDLTYREVVKGSNSAFDSLITLIAPAAQGTCVAGKYYSTTIPIESVAFVGAGALVLALVAIAWPLRKASRRSARGTVAFMAVAAAVAVVIGWVGGPVLAAVQLLPVLSNNPVARIRSVLGFVLAVLAAFGFERLLTAALSRSRRGGPGDGDGDGGRGDGHGADGHGADGDVGDGDAGDGDAGDGDAGEDADPRGEAGADGPSGEEHAGADTGRRLPVLWAVIATAGAVVLGLVVVRSARHAATAGKYQEYLADQLTWPFIAVGLAVVFVLCVRFGPRLLGGAATLAVVLLVVAESTSFSLTDLGGSDRANFYPVTSTHAYLGANLGDERFAGSDFIAFPATAPAYKLRTPTGHQFTADTWWDLLQTVDPGVNNSPTYSDFDSKTLNANTVGRKPVLDRLGVKYWLANDAEVPGQVRGPVGETSTTSLAAAQTASCQVASGPVRAIVVDVDGALVGAKTNGGATANVVLHTPSGDVTGARYLGGGFATSSQVTIAVPGEDLKPGTTLTADVSFTGLARPVSVRTSATGLACGTMTPASDGLKLVHSAPGALVYERLTSLPRIRWASQATVISDPKQRLKALASGVDRSTVVLESAAGPAAGEPATVDVTADEGGTVAATVVAQGAGYLVVADSMQQDGWSVTVDGAPAQLVPADHAFVAVAVPEGKHDVRLTYTVPGLRTGLLLSIVALVTVLGIVVLGRRGTRARRRGKGGGRHGSLGGHSRKVVR